MDEKKAKKIPVKLLAIIIVAIVVVASVVYAGMSMFGGLSKEAAASAAEKYINTDLMQGQGTVTVKTDKRVGNLYKLIVTYQGRDIDSYMTVDGKLFFPTVYEMVTSTAKAAAATTDTASAATTEVKKSDKPVVELFVMSYCPYGTQIEKGIIPAVQALGNKIDFKLKFVSYTMHGDKENQENLREYCIDKTQSAKLLPYLTCFLKASDAAGCIKSTGIDDAKITSCMASSAKEFDVTGTNFLAHAADNEKYGVQGSPTLIINGATAESGRDSASLLKTICSAFNNAPSECSATLSSASPSSGFGEGSASGATDATCN